LEIVLIILILIVIGILLFNQSNSPTKKPAVKKEEIIIQYEKDLEKILLKYNDDKPLQIQEKKKFLQNCNSELSRNIFFTHDEAVKVIERLLKQ
jgi:hypothetical protein